MKIYTDTNGKTFNLSNLDDYDIEHVWLDAAVKRAGSKHAEIVRGNFSVCAICGDVTDMNSNPDSEYHPEVYTD